MEIKYISRVKDNTVVLSGVRLDSVDEEVAISDLENISKTAQIVGYNRVTKKISVSTFEDVYSQIRSKYKLAGISLPNFEIEKVGSCYNNPELDDKEVISFSLDIEKDIIRTLNEDKDILTLTIRPRKELLEVASMIYINWDVLFCDIWNTLELDRDSSYSVEIVFDFELPEICIGKPCIPDNPYCEFAVNISNIKFTENFNMNRTMICDYLFMFQNNIIEDEEKSTHDNLVSIVAEDMISIGSDVVIDLSGYSAENVISARYMFACNYATVKYPKFSSKLKLTDYMITNKTLYEEEYNSFKENILTKLIDDGNKESALFGCTIGSVSVRDYDLLTYFTTDVRIKVLVMDCPLSEISYSKTLVDRSSLTINAIQYSTGFVYDMEHFTLSLNNNDYTEDNLDVLLVNQNSYNVRDWYKHR